MSLRQILIRSLVASALVLVASPRQAEACEGEIYIRLWQPGGYETWYDVGEEIEIASGEEGHIYIHIAGEGEDTYTAAARIGYPEEFGYQGDARTVERSVKMQAQNNDDRRYGRIRFRANTPNLVYLGYEITGVADPGSIGNVSRNCRVGYIPIRVYSEDE